MRSTMAICLIGVLAFSVEGESISHASVDDSVEALTHDSVTVDTESGTGDGLHSSNDSASTFSSAQGDIPGDGSSVQPVDRMVVTASRTQRKISETPAAVTLITRDLIENSPAKTIHDLLVSQVGIVLKRTVGMAEGIPSDIIIRGIPPALVATRMLILVDGIPTNASGTPFLIVNEIPLEAVERIEIVRGPHSSLYGANAFSGVINIITRRGDGKPRIELQAETGSGLYRSIGAWGGGSKRRLSYSVSAGAARIDNCLARSERIERKGVLVDTLPIQDHGYGHERLSGRMGLQLGEKSTLEIFGRYYDFDMAFGQTRNLTPAQPVTIRGTKILAGP